MFGYKDVFYSPGNNTTSNITNSIEDWGNSKFLVKKTIFREPDIHNPYIITQSPIYTCRLNIINKCKLITSIITHKTHSVDSIYQMIKDKMIEISIGDSTDKINKMTDNIIQLCKKANIDEHTLTAFLETL